MPVRRTLIRAAVSIAAVVAAVVALTCGGGGGPSPVAATPPPPPACRLPGGFTFSIAYAFTGKVVCWESNKQQTYRVLNNSCDDVLVRSLRVRKVATGNCSWDYAYSLSVATDRVASGADTTIRVGAAAGTSRAACCQKWPCSKGDCNLTDTYSLETDQGTRVLTHEYTVEVPGGNACSLCSYLEYGPAFLRQTAASEDSVCDLGEFR